MSAIFISTLIKYEFTVWDLEYWDNTDINDTGRF